MSNKQNVVAIDGPSGSGKSSVARKVSEDLSLLYIDTGAMFRGLGYYLTSKGHDLNQLDESLAEDLLHKCDFQYSPTKDILIQIDGEDLTQTIREHEVSKLASFVSRYQFIRDYLAKIQRDIASKSESVLEGRDIGTVIFPQAKLKIFLTASAQERAKRRYSELQSRGESSLSLEEIQRDIEQRDERDRSRDIAPLVQAQDAHGIDTTGMTIGQVVDNIKQLYQTLS